MDVGQAEAVTACKLLLTLAESSQLRAKQIALHMERFRGWHGLMAVLTWSFWSPVAACGDGVSARAQPSHSRANLPVGAALGGREPSRAEGLQVTIALLARMAAVAPKAVGSQRWVYYAVTRVIQQA
eukprot:SAG31_NODE_26336_length_444_cov_0.727536_1_plen_126_part_10